MSETFRDILGLFEDRSKLADVWDRKVPADRKITGESVNMWFHRDSVPGWSWAGLEAAAHELGQPDVTMKRLVEADLEARRARAEKRRSGGAAA